MFYRVFTYHFTDDPLTRKRERDYESAGASQPEGIQDIRAGADGSWGGGGGSIRLRDTNDFVDLSTVTNRIHRYKEYERLRGMAEIESAMTVFADETCFAGFTPVMTPTYGAKTLKWLADNLANERFLVYCYDKDKRDYTLGWAHSPRKTKRAKTVKVCLDNGQSFVCTPDHKILMYDGTWCAAGQLHQGEELMPFYKIDPHQEYMNTKANQYPRIYTRSKGWIHERQFINEWTTGKEDPKLQIVNKYCRMLAEGLSARQIQSITHNDYQTVTDRMRKAGFSVKEMRHLGKKSDRRYVIDISEHDEMDVYDLTVEKYENFATEWGIAHNCQKDDDGRVFKINVKNEEIKEELDFLMFHRTMLNLDQKKMWNIAKQTFINGDFFFEIVINPDNPKQGVMNLMPLPVDSMYRIETTKGKLVEFQQSKEGPDYQSLARVEVTQATEADLQQATAIRFAPEQIIHIRIGDDRKTFYPYGVSLMEAARGPAHQLRLMEDAMVVYRLCVTGYVRVRTKNGWKYIKDIEVGDQVYSCDENGDLFLTDIIWTVNNGVKDVCCVRSQHNEITGTATHPILVNRDGVIQYVEIQNLIPKKDKLINATRDEEIAVKIPRTFSEKRAKLSSGQRKAFTSTEYINKSELMRSTNVDFDRAKQFLYADGKSLPWDKAVRICDVFNLDSEKLVVCNKHEQRPEIVDLPEYVDEDFARLFGFLIGDGSIRSKGVGAFNQLHFSSSPDEDLNNKYADLLKKYFGKIRFERDKRSARGLGNYTVDSRFACRLFMEMGYIPGAKNKRIPEWVHTAPKAIRRAFVEGISDADGCERYTKKGLWFSTIELCNKQLIEDIKEVWHSIGLCSGKIKHRHRKGGHEIDPRRVMKDTECYGVTISDRELPKYEKVWSVEHTGQEEVYDVTVDNEFHNIVSNGIIVHQTRAPERRVFYVDVQSLPHHKAEAFIERMKDQFKKKKVPSNRGLPGASMVEERWHAPAADEDYWIPIRPNANTRVETLPGAQNLGEVDDVVFFRNKLFTALNFPKNYFNNEDVQSTRITLSAQDVKFARMIERLQSHLEDAMWEICDRHLKLLGYPEDCYEDLYIQMTPPSDWRELTRAEVLTNRITNATALQGAGIMSNFDILVEFMKYPEEVVQKMLGRLKLQQLEQLRMQIIASNPNLVGVGLPGPDEKEIGTEPGGPNPMLGDDSTGAPPAGDPMGGASMGGDPMSGGAGGPPPQAGTGMEIPDASDEDIKKYDLEIKDYAKEMDREEVDRSEI